MVKRRGLEGSDFLASERQEDPPLLLAQRSRSGCRIVDHGPAVALRRPPRGTPERQDRDARLAGCGCGVGRDPGRVRVGGIDQDADAVFGQVGGQPRRAAEAAGPHGDRLGCRTPGPSGKRQGDVEAAARGDPPCQLPGLAGAAEDEDAV